jgi:hypothetical protein
MLRGSIIVAIINIAPRTTQAVVEKDRPIPIRGKVGQAQI